MPSRGSLLWLPLGLVMLSAVPVVAQQATRQVGWIGLYKNELFDWLENGDQKITKTVRVPLFKGPDRAAPSAGSLELVATPGEPLAVLYIAVGDTDRKAFTPDLFDPDWGYGPYFHETFVERHGRWFRLPVNPFPPGTWIDTADLDAEPHLRLLEAGDIVTSPRGDLEVAGVTSDDLRARPEDPAVGPCTSAQPPPRNRFEEQIIPLRELSDADGHLLLRLKYPRGC